MYIGFKLCNVIWTLLQVSFNAYGRSFVAMYVISLGLTLQQRLANPVLVINGQSGLVEALIHDYQGWGRHMTE
jgi:fucose permease